MGAAKQDLKAVVEEQMALRRVATLVASDPDEREVFESVAEESARVLGAQVSNLIRFETPAMGTTVGGWAAPGYSHPPVPTEIPLDGDTAVPTVSRTGEPYRLSDADEVDGQVADMLRGIGIRSAVAAPINVAGRMWGAIAISAPEPEHFSERDEHRLCDFAELVAQAVANAEAREQLTQSRARLVKASDAARRRFERDLHDGAQQRLVSLALTLRAASAVVESDPERAARLLEEAQGELAGGLREIRELARGLHPPELTTHGLAPALQMLAARTPIPVKVDIELEGRLPDVVESAAYYLTAEALANVTRHAEASQVEIEVVHDGGPLLISIADDGVGGVDPSRGTGLRGLVDRVEALHGRLVVDSPPEGGTRIHARIPANPQG